MWRGILKAGATSASIMSLADVAAQSIETKGFSKARQGEDEAGWDPARTLRFGVVGLTLHGPYFFKGFAWVDRLFGPAVSSGGTVMWKTLGQKVATTQLALNPPFMILLFTWMGTLEGKQWPGEIKDNVVAKFPTAFWAGNVFWPIANFINFRFLSPQHRVAYVATCGGLWNTFISYINKQLQPVEEECNQH